MNTGEIMYTIPMYKCMLVKDRGHSVTLPIEEAKSFECCAKVFQHLMKDCTTEHMYSLYLNGRNMITGIELLAKGGQHGCAITAKDVLRGALVHNASAFIIGHNHPSGDPKPSKEDVSMTLTLIEACNVVGLPLLDHIVVAQGTEEAYSIFTMMGR
jgi:DNA repair protein RadC